MSRVKGSNFVTMRAFAEKHGVADALRASLTPDARTAFDEALAIGWYDAPAFVEVLHALGPALGKPGAEVMRELGYFSVERDMTTVHRVFFRLANPAFVLEKPTQYWSRFHDRGEWRVERLGPSQVRADLVGCGIVDTLFCENVLAYIARMFELVGAKDARWEHPACRARGGETCTFTGEWR
jgi:hypothetical protein